MLGQRVTWCNCSGRSKWKQSNTAQGTINNLMSFRNAHNIQCYNGTDSPDCGLTSQSSLVFSRRDESSSISFFKSISNFLIWSACFWSRFRRFCTWAVFMPSPDSKVKSICVYVCTSTFQWGESMRLPSLRCIDPLKKNSYKKKLWKKKFL